MTQPRCNHDNWTDGVPSEPGAYLAWSAVRGVFILVMDVAGDNVEPSVYVDRREEVWTQNPLEETR